MNSSFSIFEQLVAKVRVHGHTLTGRTQVNEVNELSRLTYS